MFILHVIANPIIPTDPNIITDAFNQKIFKFCNLFHNKGHKIYFYGSSHGFKFVKCTSYNIVIDDIEYKKIKESTNDFTMPQYFMPGFVGDFLKEERKRILDIFSNNLNIILNKNYLEGDIVVHFYDAYWKDPKQLHVCGSHGGGYISPDYKAIAFESNEWKEWLREDKEYGELVSKLKVSKVIYPWFTMKEWKPNKTIKRLGNTCLYLARCHEMKGFLFYLQLSKFVPKYDFWIAGGCYKYEKENKLLWYSDNSFVDLKEYPNVKYWGVANKVLRKELLQKCTMLLQPSLYVEPCGWNVIEAMLMGTPVIATKVGGFLNTVIENVTGNLCHIDEIDKWLTNIYRVKHLNKDIIRNYARTRFNCERAYSAYVEFFNSILS